MRHFSPRTSAAYPLLGAVRAVREDGHPEIRRGALHLGELLLGSGEAGSQAVDLAEPAALGGLGDPFCEAGDDALEPIVLIGIRSEHRATDAPCSCWHPVP